MSQKTLKLAAAGDTRTGPKQWFDLLTGKEGPSNNDAVWASPSLGLFLVCDGVSGESNKNVGGYAARALVEYFQKREAELAQAKKGTPAEVQQYLAQFIRSASLELSQSASKLGYSEYFSTLSVLWFVRHRAIVANVGDSPIYHSSHGRFSKEYKAHQDEASGALTQCMGAPFMVDVFSTQILLSPGDRFLLCSDGLLKTHTEKQIEALLQSEASAQSLSARIRQETEGRMRDDTTWIAVEIDKTAEVEATAGITPHKQLETMRQCEFFKPLEDVEIQQICSIAEVIQVKKGQLFIQEGQQGDDLFVMIEGEYAPVRKEGETWKVHSVNQPGKLIGETALIGAKRSISCAAATDLKMLKIPAQGLRDLLAQDRHGLAYKVLFQALRGAIEYRSGGK